MLQWNHLGNKNYNKISINNYQSIRKYLLLFLKDFSDLVSESCTISVTSVVAAGGGGVVGSVLTACDIGCGASYSVLAAVAAC